MQKAKLVIYIDPNGVEHEALVRAVNPLNEGFATLVYVDDKAPESDNLKTVFDVAHHHDESKDENHPDLPRFVLNCWKDVAEAHEAIPPEHPHFDHPHMAMLTPGLQQRANVQRKAELTDNAGGIPIPPESAPVVMSPAAEVSAEPVKEPDVTTQLDAAGAPPVVEETKPEADQA